MIEIILILSIVVNVALLALWLVERHEGQVSRKLLVASINRLKAWETITAEWREYIASKEERDD